MYIIWDEGADAAYSMEMISGGRILVSYRYCVHEEMRVMLLIINLPLCSLHREFPYFMWFFCKFFPHEAKS